MRGRVSIRPLLFKGYMMWVMSKKPKMVLCLLSLAALSLLSPGGEAQRAKQPGGYALAGNDDSSGKDGSQPDSSRWTYDMGGSGGGNHEREYYPNRRENARIESGNLVIAARQE